MTPMAYYYRQARAHQRACMLDSGSLTTYPSGRVEYTWGAPYGEHALSAWMAAKRDVHFHAKHLAKKGGRK